MAMEACSVAGLEGVWAVGWEEMMVAV